jgi:hypothetical protein
LTEIKMAIHDAALGKKDPAGAGHGPDQNLSG